MQSYSHALGESVFFRSGLFLGLVAFVWVFLPSVIASTSLYGLERAFDESSSGYSGAMHAVVFVLCILVMRPGRSIASQICGTGNSIALEVGGRWLILLFALLIIGFLTRSTPVLSRRLFLAWGLMTPLLIVLATLAMRQWIRALTLNAARQRRVLFAGCNEASVALAKRIRSHSELCMSVVGFFDDRSTDRLAQPGETLLGGLNALAGYARTHSVDVIFISLPVAHLKRARSLMGELQDTTASIYYVPDIYSYDVIQARMDEVLGIPVVAMFETPLFGIRGIYKRLFDMVCAGAALLLFMPLLVAIALAISVSSPGGVIFRQRRYGLDGKEIIVYKFRTMTVSEDGEQIAQVRKDDARLTPVGKILRRFSLDELPQLVNVLQGTMSLVGPRPHAVAHNEQYRGLIRGYMLRHKVRPGITGLAQVNGLRGETREVDQMKLRVQLDLEYLRRWSLWLDLDILVRTVFRVFNDKNAI